MTVPDAPAYVYRARMISVHDGDTFVLDVDCGFKIHGHINVRLYGVDAPELKAPTGPGVRDWVRTALEGRELLVRSYKDRQTFARWVCEVWVRHDDRSGWWSLADQLLDANMATPMKG